MSLMVERIRVVFMKKRPVTRTKLTQVSLAAVLATACFITLLTAGCGDAGRTRVPGVLTVGTMSDATPFCFEGPGGLTGFDVELGREIAGRLGLEFSPVTAGWDDLIPGLEEGEYDAVMAAMTMTRERMNALEFSDPYFETDQAIVVPQDSEIASGGGLSGKTVGVLGDSTPQYAAEKIPGLKEIREYDTVPRVYEALASGEVDAIVMDRSIAGYAGGLTADTRIIADIVTNEEYGIAMRKGEKDLAEKINRALAEVRSDGTLERLMDEWFGGPGQEGG